MSYQLRNKRSGPSNIQSFFFQKWPIISYWRNSNYFCMISRKSGSSLWLGTRRLVNAITNLRRSKSRGISINVPALICYVIMISGKRDSLLSLGAKIFVNSISNNLKTIIILYFIIRANYLLHTNYLTKLVPCLFIT